MEKRLVITVDGPAGSGKSTVSKILAERISYVYLDTGLLYRAIAYKAMQRGIYIENDEALRELCNDIHIPIETGGDMKVLIDGEDVSDNVRTEEIGMLGIFDIRDLRCEGRSSSASEKRRKIWGYSDRRQRHGYGCISRCGCQILS